MIVWCTFHAGGLLNDSVNGIRYYSMLPELFWPGLDAPDSDNMLFQQDGTTYHIANQTIVWENIYLPLFKALNILKKCTATFTTAIR